MRSSQQLRRRTKSVAVLFRERRPILHTTCKTQLSNTQQQNYERFEASSEFATVIVPITTIKKANTNFPLQTNRPKIRSTISILGKLCCHTPTKSASYPLTGKEEFEAL